MPIVKLRSSEYELLDVDIEVAKRSLTIKKILEDEGMYWSEESVIPLTNIKSDILRKVIEWAIHHKDDPEPPPPQPDDDGNAMKRTDDIPEWDVNFLKVDQSTLFEIILAANYLDIKGLLDVSCKTVANMIKGKTTEEISKTFNVYNDFAEAGEPLPPLPKQNGH